MLIKTFVAKFGHRFELTQVGANEFKVNHYNIWSTTENRLQMSHSYNSLDYAEAKIQQEVDYINSL